ncbi:MerR family transcriptional regulator [bacterium]|nr:MerR family transcriptional regulator [bacterium]
MAKLYNKIGEVSAKVGVDPSTLRYWEKEFDCLRPATNRAGQRIYSNDDIELIERIRELLHVQGFTLSGARRKLTSEAGRGAKTQENGCSAKEERLLSRMRSARKLAKEIIQILDTRNELE